MSNKIQAPYFIEVMARDHQVKQRQNFQQFPITIGRSYDNDCILDDPYISPHHAVIELPIGEAVPVIRDLNSENGLTVNGKHQRTMPLDAGYFTLGHTQLRFRHANYPVEATIKQTQRKQWEGWPAALLGIFLVACSTLASAWLEATEQFSLLKATLDVGTALMVILLWCGGWALATRIMSGHITKFGRHIFIVACAIICIDLWTMLSITSAYALSLSFLTRYGSHIIAIIIATMVFFHLDTINPTQKKRFGIISLCLAVIGSGFMFMNNYQRHGYLADHLYMSHLLSPSLRLSADQPTTSFIKQAEALKKEVDRARKKKIAANIKP